VFHNEKYLRTATWFFTGLTASGAILVLMGWQFRIDLLKGVFLGTFVAPNSALCFLLTSLGVLLLNSEARYARLLGTVLGAFIFLFAFATLVEYIFRADFGIDRIFFAHRLSDWFLPRPGRFALNTCVGFVFAGVALVLCRHRPLIKDAAACCILLISYLSLIGYIYSARGLYSAGAVMSPHTGVLFLLLSVSLLCAGDRPLVLSIVLSPYSGGVLSRRILPLVLFLLPGVGWLTLLAYRREYIPVEIALATLVLVAIAVFAFATLNTASILNRSDRMQRDAEIALLRNEKIGTAGRMATSVAHEINNPLEAVGNLLFLLRSSDIPEQTRLEYLTLADEEIRRVAAIARRTLGFYREDSAPSIVSPAEVVESVFEIYRSKLMQKGTVIEFSMDSTARVFVRQGELRQIIANLVSNAIDALPKIDSRFRVVVAAAEDGTVRIDMIDNGHGIPPANLPRIFEPFFTTKQAVGTGLGLWMSRELAVKNGGTIEVVPSIQGATFRLTFPAAKAEAANRRA
jgi:signal transduction histidine kinase